VGLIPLASGIGEDVVINEIQSSNGTTILDEDGDASDWIELFNRGSESIDLEGWGLSDRTDNPFKWVFPSVEIPPGGHLLVWASGKDRTESAPPPPFTTPQDVPGLVLWLDAGAETFSNGDRVWTWTDRSGHGNHALAPSFGARPTFIANAVNGRPVLRFTSASGHHLHLPTSGFNGMENLADFTVITAAKWTGGTVSGYFGAYGGSGNSGGSHFEIPSAQSLRFRVGNMNDVLSPNAVTNGSWAVLGGMMRSAGGSPGRSSVQGRVGTRIQTAILGKHLVGKLRHHRGRECPQ
jgi:hypothetical protein